ncbi:MAG: tRNA wybutosine-synthesizing 3 family protein [Candidatus Woesearchaeota archaeon]
MNFDEQKQKYLDALYKPDKSKKGGVDKRVSTLIDEINKHPDYYTTSSCSGRISLFTCQDFTKKYTADWLVVSHEKISYEQLEPFLHTTLPKQNVWFKQESFILHICARTLEKAKELLVFAQLNGYKHTGIIAMGKRFIIELNGTQKIATPIVRKGELLVSHKHLLFLIEQANSQLGLVHAGIDTFLEMWKKKYSN